MRKFNYDDDDSKDKEEIDRFFKEETEDMEEEGDGDDGGEIIQLEILSAEISLRLLSSAIKIASKSFFWKFLSPHSKLERVKNVYKGLSDLLKD